MPIARIDPSDKPARTDLGRRLRDLRAKAIAEGLPLLNNEQLETLVAEYKGERMADAE